MNNPTISEIKQEFSCHCMERMRRLEKMAEQFIKEEKFLEYSDKEIQRIELASGADLHRGFYCPSPVYELLVGNTHRGRILIRPNKNSRISHRYFFDGNERLCYIEYWHNGSVTDAEYLVYSEDSIHGITLDSQGKLLSVSEEKYSDHTLKEYFLCHFTVYSAYSPYRGDNRCINILYEKYHYDKDGLLECDHCDVSPFIDYISISYEKYRFNREDGYIKSFSRINPDGTLKTAGQVTFYPSIRKKA